MEVHHHSHTARKKWTHYFFEFFMLFLAVTLGFFVENQREHMIEHRREIQYMRTMVEDLRADTTLLNVVIDDFTDKIPALDTLTREFPRLHKNFSAPFIRNIFKVAGYEDFIPNDRTLQQLKNAGGMRLIRKSRISDSIMIYDKKVRDLLIEQEAVFDYYIKQRSLGELLNIELVVKAVNPEMMAQLEQNNTSLLVTNDKSILSKYLGYAFGYQGFAQNYILQLREVLAYATRLINLIRYEYHLK